jgi:hypothetical protein
LLSFGRIYTTLLGFFVGVFIHAASQVIPSEKMFLKYQLDEAGKRVYTLKSIKDGKVCKSAHPGTLTLAPRRPAFDPRRHHPDG